MDQGLVFGHVWAIWWWRTTSVGTSVQRIRTDVVEIDRAPGTAAELAACGVEEAHNRQLGRNIPKTLPVELLSKDRMPRSRLRYVVIHQWNSRILQGSLCRADQNLVASPEFCYVLVASNITHICDERLRRWQHVVVLAELGCELCGTYSKQNTARGFKERKMRLTNSATMRAFAAGLAHERGSALSYDALRWVIDKLNSPMETAVYLMLCLPREWGGRALPKPRSNVSLEIPDELQSKTNKRKVVPDLCWVEWGLIVEFFGEEFHVGCEHKDIDRLEIEQDMGYKVITFWKDDVLDLRKFNAKADSILRHMGIERVAGGERFNKTQQMLLEMLVRHARWI